MCWPIMKIGQHIQKIISDNLPLKLVKLIKRDNKRFKIFNPKTKEKRKCD